MIGARARPAAVAPVVDASTPSPDAAMSLALQVRNLRAGTLTLPNTNFDTGRPAQAGEYALADKTHAEWLEALAKHDFERASPPVRLALEAFYDKRPLTARSGN